MWERRTKKNDVEARAQLERIQKEHDQHEEEHLTERNYAEDIWFKSESLPHRVTAMNMDAPTEHQFDIPTQNRINRDVVKSLADCPKWSSKIIGILVAGVGICACICCSIMLLWWRRDHECSCCCRIGMRVYVARSGLCGGGGNLSSTCLYLALKTMVNTGCIIGTVFNVLLDNTGADNKNFSMICFLAWLVLTDVFEETGFFCMQKGHTYSRIDQSFRTLIVQLLGESIWTVGALVNFIFKFLLPYNCLSVEELPHIWDWATYFKPHLHEKLQGFCTSRYGTGMHEVMIRKDRFGVVRVWFRASSQASNWIPEGEGYQVFKSIPTGVPPIASGRSDEKWKRWKVQDTIRRWFRFMDVHQSEAAKIRDEWETRFEKLPPDGDFSVVQDLETLPWLELPKQRPRRPVQFDLPSMIPPPLHILRAYAQHTNACT